jgi:hypothetical protein
MASFGWFSMNLLHDAVAMRKFQIYSIDIFFKED